MNTQQKTVAILGASGSVGRASVEVARASGYPVALLAGCRSVRAMEEAARAVSPSLCVMTDEAAARELSLCLADTSCRVLSGEEGLFEAIAECSAEVFVNAILGRDGLLPSLAVLRRGARLALANKETMVIAGEHVRREALSYGAEILPVDSEHSAIFQCLKAGRASEVKRLILTASGGPFRGYDRAGLAEVSLSDALKHPTWRMGKKITVDSATLMNKAFEWIEAVHLFEVSPKSVEIVIHPESIIHSCVEYIDNTVVAEMSMPDMKTCVQYAIAYPERAPAMVAPLDLCALGRLSFERPDASTFTALSLAETALDAGGAAPAVLNAADEVAVSAFLREEISFLAITDIVAETLAALSHKADTLEDILAADTEARLYATALLSGYKKG